MAIFRKMLIELGPPAKPLPLFLKHISEIWGVISLLLDSPFLSPSRGSPVLWLHRVPSPRELGRRQAVVGGSRAGMIALKRLLPPFHASPELPQTPQHQQGHRSAGVPHHRAPAQGRGVAANERPSHRGPQELQSSLRKANEGRK